MKKIISFILLLSILASLVACTTGTEAGSDSEQDTNTSQEEQETEQKTEKEDFVNLSEVLKSEIAKPYDVPKVLIYTDKKMLMKEIYLDCQIIIVDEEGGTYKNI